MSENLILKASTDKIQNYGSITVLIFLQRIISQISFQCQYKTFAFQLISFSLVDHKLVSQQFLASG